MTTPAAAPGPTGSAHTAPAAAHDDAEPPGGTPHGRTIGVWTLSAVVVGSMVGAGVFSLPARFAAEGGAVGALVAWAVAGTGMLMMALVFQRLAVRRPDLDAGIYSYAKAGFGEYAGFLSAFGYWASACAGNVTYWVLIMATLGAVFPALGEGNTPLALVLSSVGLWVFFLLVRRGVREATAVNRVVTVAKLVPILVFVALTLTIFDPAVFAENLTAGPGGAPLADQVRGVMLTTVFVFLGVEGASVYSRHARRRRDVGRATVTGFLAVLAVFASVTMVSYGVLPRAELAKLRQPSMAEVLQIAVGPWGAVLVSVGLIVSVLGAYLAWTLMAAEVLYVAARDRDMPAFLARTRNDVPVAALLATSVVAQVLLLLTVWAEDAFTFALDLTSALALIPFLLAAGYALRLATGWTRDRAARGAHVEAAVADGEVQPAGSRRRDVVVAGIATLYAVFLLWAAGPTYLLLAALVYAPAALLFARVRHEQGRRWFTGAEWAVLAVLVAGGAAAVFALTTGAIGY